MRDPHTKDSRGFAFVTMETAEEAEAAIAGLNATELMGRTMNVEKARRGRARTPTPGQYHGPPKRGMFNSAVPVTGDLADLFICFCLVARSKMALVAPRDPVVTIEARPAATVDGVATTALRPLTTTATVDVTLLRVMTATAVAADATMTVLTEVATMIVRTHPLRLTLRLCAMIAVTTHLLAMSAMTTVGTTALTVGTIALPATKLSRVYRELACPSWSHELPL